MFENKRTTKRTYKIEQLNNRKYNMQQLIKSKHSIIRLYLELMIFWNFLFFFVRIKFEWEQKEKSRIKKAHTEEEDTNVARREGIKGPLLTKEIFKFLPNTIINIEYRNNNNLVLFKNLSK